MTTECEDTAPETEAAVTLSGGERARVYSYVHSQVAQSDTALQFSRLPTGCPYSCREEGSDAPAAVVGSGTLFLLTVVNQSERAVVEGLHL